MKDANPSFLLAQACLLLLLLFLLEYWSGFVEAYPSSRQSRPSWEKKQSASAHEKREKSMGRLALGKTCFVFFFFSCTCSTAVDIQSHSLACVRAKRSSSNIKGNCERSAKRKQSSHQAMTVVHHLVINQGVSEAKRAERVQRDLRLFLPKQLQQTSRVFCSHLHERSITSIFLELRFENSFCALENSFEFLPSEIISSYVFKIIFNSYQLSITYDIKMVEKN